MLFESELEEPPELRPILQLCHTASQVDTAKRFFEYLNKFERNNYLMGAKAALKIIEWLEPKMSDYTGDLLISLQTDSKGQEGDVRDVLITIDKWEIGLSCKHNHEAVKHSRLSDTIDFGKEWFGKLRGFTS